MKTIDELVMEKVPATAGHPAYDHRALVATAARIAVEFMQQQDAREGMPGRDPVGLRDPVPGASGSPAQSPGPVTAVAPEREADRGDSLRPVEAGAPTEPGG